VKNDSLLTVTIQRCHHFHNHYHFCRQSAIFYTYTKRKYAHWIRPQHSFTGSFASLQLPFIIKNIRNI